MQYSFLETFTGFFVLLFVVLCLYFGYRSYNDYTKDNKFKTIYATFQNVEGLNKGSSVLVSGIKIGTVEKLTLMPSSFDVAVELKLSADVNLPNDSQAIIMNRGLLGEKYITILPGTGESYIADKGEIHFTQSAINVERMIGKVFSELFGHNYFKIPFSNKQ
ncbi:mce related family protein [Orientia chuto str. Dubai]|uniref:Mce related family protein n=1 Tax=Orientia chuto str. Dubai TaxID=1359168 RepID=A0A0F3MN39_9RICK|nr:outer membrane lipid asymmetry maintenance protein MlaD [Candidatus Orientia mediorientalis]KJV57061.1 mce related family protein [Orientia chuto str. Dubai]